MATLEATQIPRDHARGYVGWLYEDVFKDLYPADSQTETSAEDAGESTRAEEPEDAEIAVIQAALAAEQARISGVLNSLKEKEKEAVDRDVQDAELLQARWGLTMREQLPVSESKLKTLLDVQKMQQEGLIVPRSAMVDLERRIEIDKGTEAQHENLLAASKPAEPNYLKATTSLKLRQQVRNIETHLSREQLEQLTVELAERRLQKPPMPPQLNAEVRAENRAIVKRMQSKVTFLKNPRFAADREASARGAACPFSYSPDCILFRDYEVGGVYEITVEFKNTTGVGRRLRVLPCQNPVFSLSSDKPAVIAPGMSAFVTVRFAPAALNDEDESLVIGTELGDYLLPLKASRIKPILAVFEDPVHCGCVLAGDVTKKEIRVSNNGGEGSFRLIFASEGAIEHHAHHAHHSGEAVVESYYETDQDGSTALVSGAFRVSPAAFYLESGHSVDLKVTFNAPEVGRHRCPVFIEWDNGQKTALNLEAITDAIRVELRRWPSIPEPLGPQRAPEGCSPWSLMPWQLNWLSPGLQVGRTASQSLTLSNGGYLPQEVAWRIAQPSKAFLSRLAVGCQQRLTQDILEEIHTSAAWGPEDYGSPDCPFQVTPSSAVLAPHSQLEFTFSFTAHLPAWDRSTAVAYLVAKKVPSSGRCLPHFKKLLDLQASMQPEGYEKGLPLFGGASSTLFADEDRDKQIEELVSGEEELQRANVVLTALCLQGLSIAPSFALLPKVVAFPGDVLPFLSHSREVKLQNTSASLSAFFQVRLSSDSRNKANAHTLESLWVIGPQPGDMSSEEGDKAAWQRIASQWPPLPPEGGAKILEPGYGSSASVTVEPFSGKIEAGQSITLRVTVRALRESDLQGHFMIDFPVSPEIDDLAAPPLRVGVFAAVRAPRVEFRHLSCLDYGVVRAHSRSTLKVTVANSSDLPMLVKLKQHRDSGQEHEEQSAMSFPFYSHSEVFDFFLANLGKTGGRKFAIASEDIPECPVEPWVHSESGCLDMSGRRKYVFEGRRPIMEGEDADRFGFLDDAEDFVFAPSCCVIWPNSIAEVDVTLRSGEVSKYRGLIQAFGFDSCHSQCMEVLAEVQLPRLRLSTQHAHFPVSYLRTASQPMEIELRNDSDMMATFSFDIPVKLEAGLEVQIKPSQGQVAARGTNTVLLVAVPTQEAELAELPCRVFVEDVLQPLELKVSAKVFNLEVDYAVIEAGDLPPEIRALPRGLCGSEQSGTYAVTSGLASRKCPYIEFGGMELQKSKTMKLVLYNRTGIATPFSLKVAKNGAYDPVTKGRKIGDLLDAATRMYSLCIADEQRHGSLSKHGSDELETQRKERQSFRNSPEPATRGRERSLEREELGLTLSTARPEDLLASRKGGPHAAALHGTKGSQMKSTAGGKRPKRKFLLDNKHEKQVFRSTMGAAYALQQELKEQGSVALKTGHGWAVKVEPSSDWLQPFGVAVVTLTCFSDLPGLMEDELLVSIRQLEGHAENNCFRIPLRLLSYGSPLYLPEQQVGLNLTMDPPQLFCGTIVPSDKVMSRKFKVGNNSSQEIRITWQVYPKSQVENTGGSRKLVEVGLFEKKGVGAAFQDEDDDEFFDFKVWAAEPEPLEDPFATVPDGSCPLRIEPGEAVLPAHGTTLFEVTMTCCKATAEAGGFYRYTLLGKGRFNEDREKQREMDSLETTSPTSRHAVFKGDLISMPLGSELVKRLPEMHLNDEELASDDSDREDRPCKKKKKVAAEEAERETETIGAIGAHGPKEDELTFQTGPDKDVISTIVVECVGDCIVPRLTVDKKANPAVLDFAMAGVAATTHVPAFKFIHSSVGTSSPSKAKAPGAMGGLGAPCPLRQVTFSNESASSLSCRFRADGPFRIREISQPGRHPVQFIDDKARCSTKKTTARTSRREAFAVDKWQTLTVLVEFVVDMVPPSEWTENQAEHVFHGDLVVEYPTQDPDEDELQRVHLIGISRRPAVQITPIPNAALDRRLQLECADQPPWAGPRLVVVEFGYVHVQSAVVHRREVLLSSLTNVLAKWQLLHVGRKRRTAPEIGSTLREAEEFRALDDKDVFEFSDCSGELLGPSKDGLVPGSTERMVRCCPVTPALPRSLPRDDEACYEPKKIVISFKPKKNELYRCKFRIQVESGLNFDFLCRGCGSYDEEDDPMDIHEA